MSELTKTQRDFINTYITLVPESGIATAGTDSPSDSDDAQRYNGFEARVRSAQVLAPEASSVLKGLIGNAYEAVASGDSTEFGRLAELLETRLDALAHGDMLPRLNEIVELGLTSMSQDMSPETVEALETSHAEAQTALAQLPEDLRGPCKAFVTEMARLRVRGEQLVGLVENGKLGPIERAAHHAEIDRIYIRVESLTNQLRTLMQEEGVL